MAALANMEDLQNSLSEIMTEAAEQYYVGNSEPVSMKDWQEAREDTISIYSVKLAKVVFGNDLLADSCVPGPGHRQGTPLDEKKLKAIIR
ncbi:hypothetical protein AALO_G00279940 [Alosa alosa]|uniref:BEN domain-containing protein n=1 Tax=Alosa alosa TaxID=278164 RepID=A0AAV6FJ47_9TELE|nr:hypothetical protein AALO_G00279940 [Alosa alosa]